MAAKQAARTVIGRVRADSGNQRISWGAATGGIGAAKRLAGLRQQVLRDRSLGARHRGLDAGAGCIVVGGERPARLVVSADVAQGGEPVDEVVDGRLEVVGDPGAPGGGKSHCVRAEGETVDHPASLHEREPQVKAFISFHGKP